MASSSVSTRIILMTGPKISSVAIAISGRTWSITVGPTYVPPSRPGTVYPRPSTSTLAPCCFRLGDIFFDPFLGRLIDHRAQVLTRNDLAGLRTDPLDDGIHIPHRHHRGRRHTTLTRAAAHGCGDVLRRHLRLCIRQYQQMVFCAAERETAFQVIASPADRPAWPLWWTRQRKRLRSRDDRRWRRQSRCRR